MPVQVTDAESKILMLLWEQSPMTMTQITNALKDITGWDKHAVISLLKRMLKKGSIRMDDVKPAKLYYPLVSREEAQLDQTQTFLGKIFEGKPVRMMSAMVQSGQLSVDEIDEIMQMLSKAREELTNDEDNC
ncbi:MAG: BlaI/MecI/CopY family transcriptional regulator [Ruminococcaceae bacterium]|nr:BlaI/MecI/CopY family transcriptional regulator [Oscillospiraceae bacterium]